MKLKEYLEEIGIPVSVFARKIGVSAATIYNIIEEGRDLRLSVALKIEEITQKRVRCKDLLPKKFTKSNPK